MSRSVWRFIRIGLLCVAAVVVVVVAVAWYLEPFEAAGGPSPSRPEPSIAEAAE